MSLPCAEAPALKYGYVNTVTLSPGEVKGLKNKLKKMLLSKNIIFRNNLFYIFIINNNIFTKYYYIIVINIIKNLHFKLYIKL